MPKITLRLNETSIAAAIKEVKEYGKKVADAGEKIAKELANRGYEVAYGVMSGHVFTGKTASSLKVIKESENKYILYAASTAILFFEFGAGVRYGGGHPWDDDFGFGPGTYPGAGHWDDPEGWWFPTSDPRLIIRTDKDGQGWGHSYGNKPYMPFYKADKQIRADIIEVAKEALK